MGERSNLKSILPNSIDLPLWKTHVEKKTGQRPKAIFGACPQLNFRVERVD